jgi:hypothetical protein
VHLVDSAPVPGPTHPVLAGSWLVWEQAGRLATGRLADLFAFPLPVPPLLFHFTGAVGRPVACGDQIAFFSEPLLPTVNAVHTLYLADPEANTRLVVTATTALMQSLACDGRTLAWLEPTATVHTYDLRTRTASVLLGAPDHRVFGDLALADGVLYYQDAAPTHTGLYARTLATGADRLIHVAGENPVAAAGGLLWSWTRADRVQLYLHRGSGPDLLLDQQAAILTGYSLSPSVAAWSYLGGAGGTGVHVYDLHTGARRDLASAHAWTPVVAGTVVAWAEADAMVPMPSTSLHLYNHTSGATTLLQDSMRSVLARTAAITGLRLVWTSDSATGSIDLVAESLPPGFQP